MSDDCIGGKMLVALAEPEQTKLACPVCGATGLTRASVVNGHGVIPHHKSVPFRSSGVVVAVSPAVTTEQEDLVAAALLVKSEIVGKVRIVDDLVDVMLPADMSDADLDAACDKVAALGLPLTVRVGLTRAGR